MKKFLLLVLLCCSLSVWSHDAEVDGIFYNLDAANKTASVTFKGRYFYSYEEYSGDVVIPETVTYGGITYSVTSLGKSCFNSCSSMTSITIPNSVTSLGHGCFSGCSGLTAITIPMSVTSLEDACFQLCSSLPSITIPNSVTSVGNYCFSNCSGLTSITIPNSVTSLGGLCFAFCSSLTSIAISNSVTSLGYRCFRGCSSLTSITIPNSVTSLGKECFWGCSNLTSIAIPNSVTSLGQNCFYECSSLTSITIPNSVTSMGSGCISGCTSLTAAIMLPSTPPQVYGGVFAYGTPLETIYVANETAKAAYQAEMPWNKYEIVVLPAGIEEPEIDKASPIIMNYYDLSGKLLTRKQRGPVIVRYSDGTTHKLLVK